VNRAQAVYEEKRGKRAFNMPKDAKRVGGNQHGIRYVFPDGSRLRIGGLARIIEWRTNEGGAIRWLWEGDGQGTQDRPIGRAP
jgi:hypothetical protein